MNEHSSGTRATVPPSATLGGTPRTDAAYLEALKGGSHSYALGWMLTFARLLECELIATDSGAQEETPDKALAEFKRLVLVAADHLADRLGHELAQGNAAKIRFLKALKQRDQLEEEVADWKQVSNEWKQRAEAAEAKLRTTEGNARESACDAGSEINPDGVADQGSVRNATDAKLTDMKASGGKRTRNIRYGSGKTGK